MLIYVVYYYYVLCSLILMPKSHEGNKRTCVYSRKYSHPDKSISYLVLGPLVCGILQCCGRRQGSAEGGVLGLCHSLQPTGTGQGPQHSSWYVDQVMVM